MTDLPDRVARALDRLEVRNGRALVAVSGGPDSLALLDLLASLAAGRALVLAVAHFDHGIDPRSRAVAARCEAVAARHHLPFHLGTGTLGPAASETEARRARLAWLEGLGRDTGSRWIVTAHHHDDQVETVLMRLLRGSGPAGLAGIAERRGPWVRPLLEVGREELARYSAERRLDPWLDPANDDPRHLRNWIRSTLLPALERRLPDVRRAIARAGMLAAMDRSAWDHILDELPGLDFHREPEAASVAAAPLNGYSSAVVRGLVQALGRRLGILVGQRSLDRVQMLLAHGATGRQVDLSGGAVAALEFGRLRLSRSSAHLDGYQASIAGERGSVEVGGWTFVMRPERVSAPVPREGLTTWVPPGAELIIRPWHPGDRIRPLGGRGSRLVVRCMQDRKVSRRSRPGWPVLVSKTEIVWVPGVCRSDALVPELGAEVVRIDASPRA